MSSKNYEYLAFISYQRKDEEVAKRLQHTLEFYNLPIAVIEKQPELKEGIRPIFVDMTELGDEPFLKPAIENALKESRFLIVICSPRSAKSKWVNKEVEYFVNLKRTKRIIPFIVEGSPNAKDREEECCTKQMKKMLGKRELLGININEMGFDAAAVKVVSRMFHVRFRTLWNRYEKEKEEQQRKLKEQNDKLLIAQSRFLAEKAERKIEEGNVDLSKRLALAALPIDISNPNRPYTSEAEYSLRKASQKDRMLIPINDCEVNYADYSPDGTTMALAMTDGSIRLMDFKTKDIRLLGEYGSSVDYVEYSNDGKYIVSFLSGWDVRIWNVHSAKNKTIHCSAKTVHLDHIGRYIVIVTKEWKEDKSNVLKIYDREKDKWLSEISFSYNIISANFSFDGEKIITLSDDNIIRIFSLSDIIEQDNTYPILIEFLDTVNIKCRDYVRNASFCPDDCNIAVQSYEHIYICDFEGAIVHKYPHAFEKSGDSITHFAFSKDGLKLVTSSYDGEVRIWDVESEACVFSDKMGSFTYFSPDGFSIVSSSRDVGAIVCAFSKELNYKSEYSCHSLDCNLDGTNHLVLSDDDKLCLQNTDNNDLKNSMGFTDKIVAACYSPDNLRIATVSKDDTICMWNASNMECLKIVRDEFGDKYLSSTEKITVSPNNNFIATTYGGWPLFSIIKTYRDFAKKICVWDFAHQKLLSVLVGHTDTVNAVSFDPKRNLLISASDDKRIRVWNIITGKCLRILGGEKTEGHVQAVNNVDYNRDGSLFASVSSDKTIKIWDSKTYKCIKTLKGHKKEVKGVCFAFDYEMDRQLLVSASPYECIRVWDIERGQCVCEYSNIGNVETVKFDSYKRVIVARSRSLTGLDVTTYRIKYLTLQKVINDTYETIGNNSLTEEERKQYYLE